MHVNYILAKDIINQIPEIPENSIISRTIYKDDRIKAILFGFAAGQELSEHTSAMAATIHILKGEAQLTLDQDVVEAGPGTWVHMLPGLPHSVYAQTPVVMLLQMVKVDREVEL